METSAAFFSADELQFGALLLFLAFWCFVWGFAEDHRPDTRVGLHAGLPAPGVGLRVRGDGDDPGGGSAEALLRSVRVVDDPHLRAAAPESVEIVLPVSDASCIKARRSLDVECGRPTNLPRGVASIQWQQAVPVQIEANRFQEWSLNPGNQAFERRVLTSWSTNDIGRTFTIGFACPTKAEFDLVSAPHLLHANCLPGGRKLRLLLAPEQGASLSVALDQVEALHVQAVGYSAITAVGTGTIDAGEVRKDIQGPREVIVIKSDGVPVHVDLVASNGTRQERLSLTSSNADRVRVGEVDIRQTYFEKYRDIWIGILLLALAALANRFWEVVRNKNKGEP